MSIETHYHFLVSSLVQLLAREFISIDKMIRSKQSRNRAFNNECANYPPLRDGSFCLGKVRLVLYMKAHRFLFKPLGPAAFQNCGVFFFFFFGILEWKYGTIYHIEHLDSQRELGQHPIIKHISAEKK